MVLTVYYKRNRLNFKEIENCGKYKKFYINKSHKEVRRVRSIKKNGGSCQLWSKENYKEC